MGTFPLIGGWFPDGNVPVGWGLVPSHAQPSSMTAQPPSMTVRNGTFPPVLKNVHLFSKISPCNATKEIQKHNCTCVHGLYLYMTVINMHISCFAVTSIYFGPGYPCTSGFYDCAKTLHA